MGSVDAVEKSGSVHMDYVKLSDFDSDVLSMIQGGVPLVRRPLCTLADQLGCAPGRVRESVRHILECNLIREVSGVFDLRSLGFSQTLVAMRVSDSDIDLTASVIGDHHGVSHCYQRDHEYNVWFTIALAYPGDRPMDMEIADLADRCGAEEFLILPAELKIKLDVRFAGGTASCTNPARMVRINPPGGPTLSEMEKRAIFALQQPVCLCDDAPFDSLADRVGMDIHELLAHAQSFLERGLMRRYGAVVNHRRAGARSNVLVAWSCDDRYVDANAMAAAASSNVSHCFVRQSFQEWPYRIYTMIHGRSRDECESVIAEIGAAGDFSGAEKLWTVREFVKRRVRLFTEAVC